MPRGVDEVHLASDSERSRGRIAWGTKRTNRGTPRKKGATFFYPESPGLSDSSQESLAQNPVVKWSTAFKHHRTVLQESRSRTPWPLPRTMQSESLAQNLVLKWLTQNHARTRKEISRRSDLCLGLSLTNLPLPGF